MLPKNHRVLRRVWPSSKSTELFCWTLKIPWDQEVGFIFFSPKKIWLKNLSHFSTLKQCRWSAWLSLQNIISVIQNNRKYFKVFFCFLAVWEKTSIDKKKNLIIWSLFFVQQFSYNYRSWNSTFIKLIRMLKCIHNDDDKEQLRFE